MGSGVIVHRISDGQRLSRHSILPEHDQSNEEMCAAEIVLCPPLQPDGPSLLIATNRFSTHPDGDALALFKVSTDGSEVTPAPEHLVWGAGAHLRGLAVDPSGRWVVVLAREWGGMTMYERVGKGLELKEVARLADVERTVVAAWL